MASNEFEVEGSIFTRSSNDTFFYFSISLKAILFVTLQNIKPAFFNKASLNLISLSSVNSVNFFEYNLIEFFNSNSVQHLTNQL